MEGEKGKTEVGKKEGRKDVRGGEDFCLLALSLFGLKVEDIFPCPMI